ncbi:MAG: 2-isopropylmalate synthase, partial [Clostridiales bacterium]|nr:2-isopropylmalate synthase [Clostridiales bacterium]
MDDIRLNNRTNLLERAEHDYVIQDIKEPNLFREIFEYTEVPKVPFNFRNSPLNMPENIYITDTTFRDGQQSREPYTVKQIVDIYKMISKLSGEKGIVRQTEFFVYSERDREAIRRCQDLGLRFPEITTWIRAKKEDFKLVHDI